MLFIVIFFSQVNWIKYPMPVITPSELWEIFGVSDNTLLYEGGVYKIWYSGGGLVLPDTIPKVRIGAAVSFDGINWTKLGMVLSTGDSGDWDAGGVETATVVRNTTGYHMWFDGYAETGWPPIFFGYASSSDGINWTKWPSNPVMTPGGPGKWDNLFIDSPSVLFENDTFKMWYTGVDSSWLGGIGLAFSTDGMNWTKYSGNPVFTPTSFWDSALVGIATVKHFGSFYEMWYTGWRNFPDSIAIGYATSPDGIFWTPYPKNPVLTLSDGSWDSLGVAAPDVLLTSQYEMWYTGSFVNRIGLATAPVNVWETVSQFFPGLEYPGVFSSTLTVYAPRAREISLFGVTGRRIFTGRNEKVLWNTSSLGNGVYFVRAKWDERIQWVKVIRIR